MKIYNLLLLAVASLMLVACGTTGQEVVYMQNIDQIPTAALGTVTTQAGDFTIKSGDMLLINVSSSNSDAVRPFNKIQYMPRYGGENGGLGGYSLGDRSTLYYLVDDNGNIDFPILGRLHVGGMTKSALEGYVANLIYPRYLTEMPNVECRIQNFRVFCIGDFGHSGVVTAENGRLNLIEAIAMSGDLQMSGRRDNVLLIRTDPSGQRMVKRIDLRDASFMAMPEFELQQNDILYVEPNKYKKRTVWSLPPIYNAAVGVFGTALSIINTIILLTKKF
jgi:polysaccharide export outer membrane protein